MRKARFVAWAVLMSLVASGCGAHAASKPLPIRARVIGHGGFRGFTLEKPRSFGTAKAYLSGDSGVTGSQREAWVARLTNEGFESAVSEFLDNRQGTKTGVSGVVQLGSAASARAELAAELRLYREQGARTFAVKTIPGAVGYGFKGPTGGGSNVLFADGPFLYFEGYGWYGSVDIPKRSALIDAAAKLYSRVHGHPAT